MFPLIEQVLTVLLSSSEYLAHDQTKFLTLNVQPCMVIPFHIDLNTVELKCYPFMISLINVVELLMSCHQKCEFEKKQKT